MSETVTCMGCFRELESGEKYVQVEEHLVGEIVKKSNYGCCCSDVKTVSKR